MTKHRGLLIRLLVQDTGKEKISCSFLRTITWFARALAGIVAASCFIDPFPAFTTLLYAVTVTYSGPLLDLLPVLLLAAYGYLYSALVIAGFLVFLAVFDTAASLENGCRGVYPSLVLPLYRGLLEHSAMFRYLVRGEGGGLDGEVVADNDGDAFEQVEH